MSFIARKVDSMTHRIRTKIFRKSGAWEAHPLNPRKLGLPATDWGRVHRELVDLGRELGFPVTDWPIDLAEYERFRVAVPVPRLYAVGYKDKKILEHFIAYKLLELAAPDVYMDVASEQSPFPELFRRHFKLTAYSQDLSYPPGVRGTQIGSSADAIPLQDRSLNKMSLQCAFEHFEGDADTGFMREAARLLVPGGRCVIVPLYLSATYLNIIDPVMVDPDKMRFDPGCTPIGETDLGGRFERIYSPWALRRILIPELRYELFRILGHEQITPDRDDPVYRVRYALRATRP